MTKFFWLVLAGLCYRCQHYDSHFVSSIPSLKQPAPAHFITRKITDTTSWEYFLQHLPEVQTPIVNYKGQLVNNQAKCFSVINYDVGTRDLQQCADALIRLRAEYLFKQHRFSEIAFHFTSGDLYSFTDYCNGKRPLQAGRKLSFSFTSPQPQNKQFLRKYLDIVYIYAGTISLASELAIASEFAIGTVVITPGSPGHCFIIADEAVNKKGEKFFKLVEGYTPAQSIYVLRNASDPELGCWHKLTKSSITTASYEFTSYKLKKFE